MTNNMLYINVKNAREIRELLTIATKLGGFKIHKKDITIDDFMNNFYQNKFGSSIETIRLDFEEMRAVGYYNSSQSKLTYSNDKGKILDIIMNHTMPNQIIVDGVGLYKAVIDADGITVGCTKITFDKFDEIAQAVKTIRE